ncbi:hypothetical protein L7F22_025271 [Adiantum nelumboides]|nr:hypothetical protein [Adiantum nelumboides]
MLSDEHKVYFLPETRVRIARDQQSLPASLISPTTIVLCTPLPAEYDASHTLDSGASTTTTSPTSSPHFDCGICLDVCYDPVVTICGHLFCWPCLYHWLSLHSILQECPACKENVQPSRVIPLYDRDKVACSKLLAERFPDVCNIACHPTLTSHA